MKGITGIFSFQYRIKTFEVQPSSSVEPGGDLIAKCFKKIYFLKFCQENITGLVNTQYMSRRRELGIPTSIPMYVVKLK